MIWLILALATVISACLYRMGGCGPTDLEDEWGWVPAPVRNFPKKRDVGCGLVTGAACFAVLSNVGLSSPWWIYLLTFGILWGALSTYHDTMFYNWMKPKDNFWLHGFFCGLAYILFGIHNPTLWLWLGLRVAAVAIFMGVWSHILFTDAKWEEMGRGAILPLSLALLLL
jgi:hypothetical protein